MSFVLSGTNRSESRAIVSHAVNDAGVHQQNPKPSGLQDLRGLGFRAQGSLGSGVYGRDAGSRRKAP